MEIFLVIIIWWLIGLAIFLYTIRTITTVITVRDCLVGIFAGTLGILGLVFYFMYANKKWLDKRIF